VKSWQARPFLACEALLIVEESLVIQSATAAPQGALETSELHSENLGLQSQVITGEGVVRMLESAVEWLGGLCLSALAFLMSLCFIGSIVAALRAVSRALDAADVWLHSDLR
jgi:hypothetical protein